MAKLTLPEDDPGTDGLNGISAEDFKGPEEQASDQVPEDLFEFTCTCREQDDEGRWHYFVEPTEEYDVLDFKGHDVLINGVVRPCFDFYLDDSEDTNHMVIVSESG
ncbi:MAG: hypothetical protein QNJ81_02190 [Acidimicrobiia bacterium]|nr:hypothetical protein [Acidimicrobiia bacterium]